MQIYLTFTCRECGEENTLRTDTADYAPDVRWVLRCPCGHVSGNVFLGYEYLISHRPSTKQD